MEGTHTSSCPILLHSGKRYWSETAFNWLERSQRRSGSINEEPTDPTIAAWSFVRNKTGISFVDEAIKAIRCYSRVVEENRPPFLELIGKTGATTLVLTSLAARFVVSTRWSKFVSTLPQPHSQPQVVLLDSLYTFSMPLLVRTIRSALVLEMTHVQDTAVIDLEVEDCLKRIHLVFVTDVTVAVAGLEALRIKLKSMDLIPNLLLWDEFLTTIPDTASKVEVTRQLTRLWYGTNTFVMVASPRRNSTLEKHITCQIIFEPKDHETHIYVAKVCGIKFIVTIGTAGILS